MNTCVAAGLNSVSQILWTRKHRTNKSFDRPRFRVPKFWDTELRASVEKCEPGCRNLISETLSIVVAIYAIVPDQMMVSVAPSWSTTRRWISRCDGCPASGSLKRGREYDHVVSRHCTEARGSASQNVGTTKCGVPNPLLSRVFRAPKCWDTRLRTGATLPCRPCHKETVARSQGE